MSDTGKCPNCAATVTSIEATTCEYCGAAMPHSNPKFRTKSEELGYEINGLSFTTVAVLIIVGILWQVGFGRIATMMAIGWGLLLVGYSVYLYRRFGK